jgi:quercetin 2,3-dioxygenase
MPTITKDIVIHRAKSRGHADHGWLKSFHTFSFANYFNAERIHFGALRVLNDDTVQAGMGFGKHPHNNMEIISIPLEGDLEHRDSMGNVTLIRQGDVQVMSAGTGVTHSEFNKNKDKAVQFLQIWVLPDKRNVEPRYDQISIRDLEKRNEFFQIVSPFKDEPGVWIHQSAWFHLGKFDSGISTTYSIKKEGNGIYAFVLEGSVRISGVKLETRDGLGIMNTREIEVASDTQSAVLLMEVPMIDL